MTLRVAHMIGGLGVGGAERHLVNLLNAMSCDFRAVIFLSDRKAGPGFYDELDGAIEQCCIDLRVRNLPVSLLRLSKLIARLRIDVLHTHMFTSNLYGALAGRLARVPVIVTTEHGENPWKKPSHRWIERYVISPMVDLRFCVSPRILELRRAVDGIPASKLLLTVNGTLLPEIVERDGTGDIPVVTAVGRFIPAKNYPLLIEVAARLHSEGYRFQMFILGDGPEMPRLRGLLQQSGLGDLVKLPGLVDDVAGYYRKSDIYVSSSDREGQPLALLEAMAHGLPVVATDVGASAETVRDGEGGFIVPANDAAALAAALKRLISDTKERQRLGQGARKRVEERYSIDAVAENHVRQYHRLMLDRIKKSK